MSESGFEIFGSRCWRIYSQKFLSISSIFSITYNCEFRLIIESFFIFFNDQPTTNHPKIPIWWSPTSPDTAGIWNVIVERACGSSEICNHPGCIRDLAISVPTEPLHRCVQPESRLSCGFIKKTSGLFVGNSEWFPRDYCKIYGIKAGVVESICAAQFTKVKIVVEISLPGGKDQTLHCSSCPKSWLQSASSTNFLTNLSCFIFWPVPRENRICNYFNSTHEIRTSSSLRRKTCWARSRVPGKIHINSICTTKFHFCPSNLKTSDVVSGTEEPNRLGQRTKDFITTNLIVRPTRQRTEVYSSNFLTLPPPNHSRRRTSTPSWHSTFELWPVCTRNAPPPREDNGLWDVVLVLGMVEIGNDDEKIACFKYKSRSSVRLFYRHCMMQPEEATIPCWLHLQLKLGPGLPVPVLFRARFVSIISVSEWCQGNRLMDFF